MSGDVIDLGEARRIRNQTRCARLGHLFDDEAEKGECQECGLVVNP